LGDTDNHPKIEVFVISRNAEVTPAEADLSLVIVALVGTNRPVVSLAEVWAHLSSVYRILEGTATVNAWIHRAYPGQVDGAADGHDSSGADGTELLVLERTCCVESMPDPMKLEAELATQSSVVPPVRDGAPRA
jgi:hypothetical protein